MSEITSPHKLLSTRIVTDLLITEEAQWFCAVHSLLEKIFVRSRRAHHMHFHDGLTWDRDASLDNDEGGSALLTEIQGLIASLRSLNYYRFDQGTATRRLSCHDHLWLLVGLVNKLNYAFVHLIIICSSLITAHGWCLDGHLGLVGWLVVN